MVFRLSTTRSKRAVALCGFCLLSAVAAVAQGPTSLRQFSDGRPEEYAPQTDAGFIDSLGDLDGDGRSDGVSVRQDQFGDVTAHVVYADAEGRWGDERSFALGGLPLSVLRFPRSFPAADLNGDGLEDLVLGGPTVVLAQPGRSFGTPQVLGSGTAEFLVAEDLDADGDRDIAGLFRIGPGTGSLEFRAFENLGGTFSAAAVAPSSLPFTPWCVAAQIDGVGALELVAVSSGTLEVVSFGAGLTPSVQSAAPIGALFLPDTPVLALDDDGDGDDDLFAAEGGNLVRLANNAGVIAAPGPVLLSQVRGLDSADTDGDGDLDIVASFEQGQRLGVIPVGAGGVLQPLQEFTPSSGFFVSVSGLRMADLDGDGRADVVTRPFFSARVRSYFGTGPHAFRDAGRPFDEDVFDGLPSPRTIGAGDFDGDGRSDLVLGTSSGWDVALQVLAGRYLRSTGVTGAAFPFASDLPVKAADFDGDGLEELVFATPSPFPSIPARLRVIDPVDLTEQLIVSSAFILDFDLGDLDGDQDIDLALWTGGSTRVFLNDGVGNVSEQSSAFPPNAAGGRFRLVDFDQDGDLDRVSEASDGVGDRVYVALNDGNASFSSDSSFPASGAVPIDLPPFVVDLDSDGDLDVVGGSSLLPLLNDGSGNLTPQPSPVVPLQLGVDQVLSSQVADFDLDGIEDLLVGEMPAGSGSSFGPLTLHLGLPGGGFEPDGERLGFSFPGPLLSDMDSDGDLDVVAQFENLAFDLRTPLLARIGRRFEWAYRMPVSLGAGAAAALLVSPGPYQGLGTPFGVLGSSAPAVIAGFVGSAPITHLFAITIPPRTSLLGAEILSQVLRIPASGSSEPLSLGRVISDEIGR